MDIFVFDVKNRNIFLYVMIMSFFLLCRNTFAGNLIEADGFTMYSNDYGEIVKDTWVWIDTNKDSIAECYRFDKEGHLAINYKDRYGKATNDKGQLVEKNEVIKKMLSTGEILNKKETPTNGILGFLENIIISTNKTIVKEDKWTRKEEKIIEYETNGINETIDGKVLYYKNNNEDEVDILNGEVAESGIIYSGGKVAEISDGVSDNRDIVAGKDFRRFISSKDKCTEKVTNVKIYGGDVWKDVLELYGNGASVKFLLNGNNYIRFEIANENHIEESVDTDISLEMYFDGKLVDRLDEFVDDKPQIVEEYIDDETKTVELKLNIKTGMKTRKVYIRNGRLKKTKIED